jgi:hypothetical protein
MDFPLVPCISALSSPDPKATLPIGSPTIIRSPLPCACLCGSCLSGSTSCNWSRMNKQINIYAGEPRRVPSTLSDSPHPCKVSVTVTGGHLAAQAITLSKRVGEDDPSIQQEGSRLARGVSEIIDAALHRPVIYPEVPDDFPLRTHRPWTSVKERIRKRHEKGRKAFRYRKWQVKRGEYDDSPPELSTMAARAEWRSAEKGSKLWEERRALFWKLKLRGCSLSST